MLLLRVDVDVYVCTDLCIYFWRKNAFLLFYIPLFLSICILYDNKQTKQQK